MTKTKHNHIPVKNKSIELFFLRSIKKLYKNYSQYNNTNILTLQR